MESKGNGPPFVRLWGGYRDAAQSANLSRPRYDVFLCLTAFTGDGDAASRPVRRMAEELHMHPSTVRRHLAALAKTEFEGPGGKRAAFITEVRKAAPGRCAAYRVNVPREPWR